MTCSLMLERSAEADVETAKAAVLAERLCGETGLRLRPIVGGGNNRLFRVETGAGRRFALKLYGPVDARGDRLGREFDGLALLGAYGVADVAVPVAADREARAALYAWIDGAPALAAPDARDIDRALALAADLRRIGGTKIPWTGEAAEACLSLEMLAGQLHGRLERLRSVAGEPALSAFLEDYLAPVLTGALTAARGLEAETGIDPATPLASERRILSPSDFGFHNALRRPDGGLTFIDFEYFGWDDPVKLAADFIWHPGMGLQAAAAGRWFDGVSALFADDPTFKPRLTARAPLFAIRWCLIILNEFLPERWRRRLFAGGGMADWAAAKTAQLTKAQELLSRARVGNGAPPATTVRPST